VETRLFPATILPEGSGVPAHRVLAHAARGWRGDGLGRISVRMRTSRPGGL